MTCLLALSHLEGTSAGFKKGQVLVSLPFCILSAFLPLSQSKCLRVALIAG